MLKLILVRFNQFFETWKSEGFSSVWRKAFFINKVVLPAVKDLSSLPPLKVSAKTGDVRFVEIQDERFSGESVRFPSRSRELRVPKNLKKGYRGFAIIKGEDVIGDMWYCTGEGPNPTAKHPDLEWFEWFGVTLGDKDVYMFEMYVKPQERGGWMVNILHWNALKALREKGFEKVYGYCTADNVPALWVHRTLGYKEVGRFKMHRLMFLTRRSLKGSPRRVMYRFFDLT
jgi:hypothetical protein